MDWLRKTLDPFHDFQVTVKGMPDATTGSVVVREVTKSLQVKAPAGLTPGATWDAHFFTLPEMISSGYLPSGFTGANFAYTADVRVDGGVNIMPSQPAAGVYGYGPFNCFSTITGAATAPKTGVLFDPVCGANSPITFDEYAPGQKRVLAMAFEVHDTTADLYKQGSVTVYRQPQANTEGGFHYRDVTDVAHTSVRAAADACVSRAPPASIQDALLLPGSSQWESRDGAYCVSHMRPDENDVEGTFSGFRLFTQGDTASITTGRVAICSARDVDTVNAPPAISAALSSQHRPIPFDTVGAYFSGLNERSTLTWTVKMLIEDHPTSENTQLVTLAHPGCEYDPVALELYKAATLSLKAGVKVGDNASGDFWDSVLQAIQDGAELLGPVLPGLGKPLAKAVSAGAQIAQKIRNKTDSGRVQNGPGFSNNPGGKNAVTRK